MDYSFIIYVDYETMAEFIPDKKFQSIITAIENGQNVFLYGPGGTGKCLSPNQGVLKYDGSVVKAKDVQKEDLLMGDDSTPRRVLSTCTGEDEMFRLRTSKGDDFTVNSAHILSLKCSYNNKIKWEPTTNSFRVMWNENGVRKSKAFSIFAHKTKEIAKEKANELLLSLNSGKGEIIDISVRDYLDKSKTWKDQYRLFKVGVNFPKQDKELLVDPYYLGLWIGVGTSTGPDITTIEPEIVDWLTVYAEQLGQILKRRKGKIVYAITGISSGLKLRSRLKMLNLLCNKHIPDQYLRGSRDIRMQVLAGLLDSDGYFYGNMYEITQKNSKLMQDIMFLVRSLGFACYFRPCEKTCTNGADGPKTGTYHRGSIYGEGLEDIPVLLPRKKAVLRKQIKDALVLGFEITPLGKGKYCGFTLDGNHRFLLDNFIVTHNTHMLKEIAAYLQEKGKVIGVTATTGVAALNLNIPERKIQGRTLHSWGGVGLGDGVVAKLVAKIMSKPAAKKRWMETEILIIDEVSMLGGDFFDKLDFIGRTIRSREMDPLGGIQLILSGDFMQLPPVKDEFCFKSLAWKELNLTPFMFLDPKRYDDVDYFHLLLRVRDGEPTNEDIKCLYARVQAYEHFCKMVKECADETKIIKPTEAYSHRSNVEFTNDKELEKLPGQTYDFNCIDSLNKYTKNFKKEYYIKQLEDAVPQKISLKVGAQVMLKCNMSFEQGLVNGSRGVVTNIDYEMEVVTVKFLRGRTARIERHEWEFEDKEGKGIRSQIPLILAWACTIHKLQGCTLDFCVLDLGHTIFACGQAYVGLSRVRSLKGLFLSSFETSSIMTSKTALQYSKELQLKEKLLDDCEGSCNEVSENFSDNDSEVELSNNESELTLSIDSEDDSNEIKWNVDNWDEEEFIAELILDNDWVREFDQGKFKRRHFFDSEKRYDIVDKEVEKLWQWVPLNDFYLYFGNRTLCEVDDCYYDKKYQKRAKYTGGYVFIPTKTSLCDVCYNHSDEYEYHIVSDTTYEFANSVRKKVITRIQQIPVKTKVVFRK